MARPVMRPATEQKPEEMLGLLREQERMLSLQHEDDARRSVIARRILLVVALVLIVSTFLIFRDPDRIPVNYTLVGTLIVLAATTVLLLVIHRTGQNATLYKLQHVQREISTLQQTVPPPGKNAADPAESENPPTNSQITNG